MTKKSLFILLVLIFMFSCILSGCEKTDEVAISSDDIPISNEEQTVDTPSTIQSPNFQKISPDYQTEYIKYDSPYHGLYDDIKRFPDYRYSDNQFCKDYSLESYYNIVARYVMQKYPDVDVSNITCDDDDIVYYNLLEGNKFTYNYGAAFVYTINNTDSSRTPSTVIIYDPINDKIFDLYTDELSSLFAIEMSEIIDTDNVFLSGFGQGKIQGNDLIEMEPFLFENPSSDSDYDYIKAIEDQRKMSMYGRTNVEYKVDVGNLNFVEKQTSFKDVLDFICAVSVDSENKTGDYYVDGGAVFYLLIDYKKNAEYTDPITTVTFSDGTKKSYTDISWDEASRLEGCVGVGDPEVPSDRISALSLDYNEIDTPILDETLSNYVSFVERKQYTDNWSMPVFVFSPNTVEYEFIYSIRHSGLSFWE